MDEWAKKRFFYPQQKFVDYMYITRFIDYPDGLCASVPTSPISGNGKIKTRSFSQDFRFNMHCVLSFMVNHMTKFDINGVDMGSKKDVQQAFYGGQWYIERETTLSQSAISIALSSLVSWGILRTDKSDGVTYYAFSERTIAALIAYAEKRENLRQELANLKEAEEAAKEARRKARTTPKQPKKPDIRQSNIQYSTVKYPIFDSQISNIRQSNIQYSTVKFGSYIEEKGTDSGSESSTQSSMDGCKSVGADAPPDSQPVVRRVKALTGKNLTGFYELCKKVEFAIKGDTNAYAVWEETENFMLDRLDSHGERTLRLFVEWLPAFVMSRLRNGKLFKKSSPWASRLAFCWESYLDELKRAAGAEQMGVH